MTLLVYLKFTIVGHTSLGTLLCVTTTLGHRRSEVPLGSLGGRTRGTEPQRGRSSLSWVGTLVILWHLSCDSDLVLSVVTEGNRKEPNHRVPPRDGTGLLLLLQVPLYRTPVRSWRSDRYTPRCDFLQGRRGQSEFLREGPAPSENIKVLRVRKGIPWPLRFINGFQKVTQPPILISSRSLPPKEKSSPVSR